MSHVRLALFWGKIMCYFSKARKSEKPKTIRCPQCWLEGRLIIWDVNSLQELNLPRIYCISVPGVLDQLVGRMELCHSSSLRLVGPESPGLNEVRSNFGFRRN